MKSKIEDNSETGRKCLITFYNSELEEFDDSINQAIGFHHIIDGQMNVIALPENSDCQSLLLTVGSGN